MPPLITPHWQVLARLEEIREQIRIAKLFDRDWTKTIGTCAPTSVSRMRPTRRW